MKKSFVTMLAAVILMGFCATVMADEGAAFISGSSTVGFHYYDEAGFFGKVGEFTGTNSSDGYQADATFDMNGGTDHALFEMNGQYMDQDTKSFGFSTNANGRVSASFNYQSFLHRLDHDLLTNMQAKEANGEGGPAGKQVYYTDHDPNGQYSINYEKIEAHAAYNIDTFENGKMYVNYTDQNKHGWKQSMTLDHCTFCHVEGQGTEVNNQTRTWDFGLEGAMGKLSFSYNLGAVDYTDRSSANTHVYDRAMHPTRGDTYESSNYNVEFGSRLAYQEEPMPFDQGTTTEKRSHALKLNFDVNEKNVLKSAFTSTRNENMGTSVVGTMDAWAAGWVAKPNKKTRLTARVLKYDVKVDDYFVDMDIYREGRPGGDQDFDWTRVSAANREVLQTDMALRYRLAKGSLLSFDWRHKVIDRAAMNQTQTTYFAAGEEIIGVGSEAQPWETTTDRFRAAYRKRLGNKGNARMTYTFTNVSKQYMNILGICEDEMRGESYTLPGNGNVYYFQRLRTGNATSMPNKSHKLALRSSYQLSPRMSLNGYLNFADEKNDEMNTYEFTRTVFSPGATLWMAPTDKMMVTMGYSFNSVESNASMCIPLFGG
jgi:hypothetical protein